MDIMTTTPTTHSMTASKMRIRLNLTKSTIILVAAYVLLFIIDGCLRWTRLGFSDESTPVFDEKHYVPQAWQMIHLGMENNPGYGLVVHPPLGKAIIGIGEIIAGYTPFGWRIGSVLCGELALAIVLATIFVATKNLWAPLIGGVLFATDPTQLVMSRMGMLDAPMMLFVALSVFFAVAWVVYQRDLPLGKGYFLTLSGLMMGLATTVKMSGAYLCFVALGVGAIVTVDLSRAYRLTTTISRIAWLVVYFAIFPLATFIASWLLPWLIHDASVYKHDSQLPNPLPEWIVDYVPHWVNAFYSYLSGIVSFHSSLTLSSGNFHPWQSTIVDWVTMRSSLLTYAVDGRSIYIYQNWVLWAMLIPVTSVLVALTVMKRNPIAMVLASGLGATVWMWALFIDRQSYIFYMTPASAVLAISVGVCAAWAYSYAKDSGKKNAPAMAVGAMGVILVAAAAFFAATSPFVYYTKNNPATAWLSQQKVFKAKEKPESLNETTIETSVTQSGEDSR